MSTPIPDRRPHSDPAGRPDIDVERSESDHTTQSAGAAEQPCVPPGLRELAERARAKGVPPRSPQVTFASPGSAPQSQLPRTNDAHATHASIVRRITSSDELRALLDSSQSETVDTLIVAGALKESDFGLFPQSVRHLRLDADGGVTPAALAHLEGLALRSLRAEPRTQAGDEGAIVLGRHPTLESIVIPANGIGNRGAQALSRSATLRSADLSENWIGDEGGIAFAQSTFEELLFYDNELGAKSAVALIRESRATALAFGGNPITEPRQIAVEVSRNARLKFVDLGNCRLGNGELGAIAASRSIESLGLERNLFDIGGIQMLVANEILRSLKLGDNDQLFDDSAILLSTMTWLKELEVGGIPFDDSGFSALRRLESGGVRVEADWPQES